MKNRRALRIAARHATVGSYRKLTDEFAGSKSTLHRQASKVRELASPDELTKGFKPIGSAK